MCSLVSIPIQLNTALISTYFPFHGTQIKIATLHYNDTNPICSHQSTTSIRQSIRFQFFYHRSLLCVFFCIIRLSQRRVIVNTVNGIQQRQPPTQQTPSVIETRILIYLLLAVTWPMKWNIVNTMQLVLDRTKLGQDRKQKTKKKKSDEARFVEITERGNSCHDVVYS